MDQLEENVGEIRTKLEEKSAVRDTALQRSRALIRHCATAIRAAHRGDFADSSAILLQATEAAGEMSADLEAYPDLYYAGYTQDALKEYVEARMVFCFMTDGDLPTPEELAVEPPAYLKGMAEAASEMRRHSLDLMRQNKLSRAEEMMAIMEDVYSQLITVDFPDALTGGLRRTTDMLRGVVQRTRGDLTTAFRQEMMRQALRDFETRMGIEA